MLKHGYLLLFLALPLLFGACAEDSIESSGSWVRAKQIGSELELIGGPSARGKVGDFIIENDRVRFIVTGKGQSWAGGVFGGSLVDADLQRWWPEFQNGRGLDSFGETFPLINMVVANPELPGSKLGASGGGLKLQVIPSGVEVIEDGSDGTAIVRVSGRAGYMFEALKFLNKGFLLSFLSEPLSIAGLPELPVGDLLDMFLGVNVFGLINRLQIDFLFHNDYILRPGQSFLTIRTTVITSPPASDAMGSCPEVTGCKLSCDNGFALQEVEYELEGQTVTGKAMCPVCECAGPGEEMVTLNESEDIFQIMLGDLEPWRDPSWKGGMLGGDFLFFGSEANIFSPGLGFDENRKIFENMWQGVPTLANPLTFDWLAAVSNNVSYGWFTINPDQREGGDCPSYRLAITKVNYDEEQEVIDTLVTKLGMPERAAKARVRHVIVDRKPLVLMEVDTKGKGTAFDKWMKKTLAEANAEVPGEDPENPDEVLYADLFPKEVELSLIPATECLDSKMLIPIFSTSATGVMTHKSPSSLEIVDGVPVDKRRTYSFERYLVVGEGDVGSVLSTVYEAKGIATGTISGLVLDDDTRAPVRHASVFAILDPRDDDTEKQPANYDELIALNVVKYGHEGIMSQMQSDRALDLVENGDFSGPLLPGRYFLVAFSKGRGISKPVPVVVDAGEKAIAHLLIPTEGTVHYVVKDHTGLMLPSRLTFISLDKDEQANRWDLANYVELGGSRYDQGIYLAEHSASGEGTVQLPPGRYEIFVSRGFEYSVEHFPAFEVTGGHTKPLTAVLAKEVDTTGYISGDFHVHAYPSIDSSLPLLTRVAANAAEGVEYITSTDHDILVDYKPYINQLGLQEFMKSEVGVETTTLEFGHYNGFPMEYDNTDVPVYDPPPWYGLPLAAVWEMMRERVDHDFNDEDFVVQVNHPRDGFTGYFSQLGLKGYSLERSTPGMELCNLQTETIPCNFDTVELMNEKRFELLRTPTVWEKQVHNDCFGEIMKATDPDLIGGAFDADPADIICFDLRQDPHDNCATIAEEIKASKAVNLELARLYAVQDHCAWHQQFVDEMSECDRKMGLVKCKKQALDALKLLTVRYMVERTPEEQDAFYATTSATDIGCSLEKAMIGCEANVDEWDNVLAGCGGEDCVCEACVCTTHPECCLTPGQQSDEGIDGTGWTVECGDWCRGECFGCENRPCTNKQQVFDDWFNFLNHGFNVTGVGNSDSHNVKAEVGFPRNYIVSSTDNPWAIDTKEIMRNMKEHRVVVSTGPFMYFTINQAAIGDTVAKPEGDKLDAHIHIQTASWFAVDRVEIYRNAKLEHILRIDPDPAAIVDFDQVVKLDMPDEDSWYVVITYGLNTECGRYGRFIMSPVYKRIPLGKMLIPTIIALGAQSILISFQSVLDEVEAQFGGLLGGGSIEDLLGDFMGTEELPDNFPMFPLAITNPIWVDLDGDGFDPPAAVDADGDGQWDLPPFCSRPCTVPVPELDEDGNPLPVENPCGENQQCVPDAEGGLQGICKIPIPDNCVGSQVAGE